MALNVGNEVMQMYRYTCTFSNCFTEFIPRIVRFYVL
jgi:hypothetical protein